MGNWKEIGVVPDSDDEGFDSDESSQLSTPPDSPSPPATEHHGIWDFLGSSGPFLVEVPTAQQTPASSRISQAHLQSQSLSEQPTSSIRLDVRDNATPLPRISESPDPLGGTQIQRRPAPTISPTRDESSPTIIRTKPRRGLLPRSSPGQDQQDESTSRETEKGSTSQTPIKLKPLVPQRALPDLESPEQGRRSLRPRKPIQEHPYLLENAQYSRFMKTHGMKPVRVTVPQGSPSAKGSEEDSQDREYTGPESQPTSGLPDEETQAEDNQALIATHEDDVDELALSPSPKTSSPQRHLRGSSDQSPSRHTDNTSLSDDEEFPDIKDLLAGKSTVSTKPSKRRLPSQSSISRKRKRTKRSSALQDSSPPRLSVDFLDLPLSLGSTPSRGPLETNRAPGSASASRTKYYGAISQTPSPQPEVFSRRSLTPNAPLVYISSDESTADDDDDDDDKGSQPDGSASERESDMLRQTGKRIKGVLPASWLRLDQQTRKVPGRKIPARDSPPRDLDQPRPGLATRKFGPPRSTASTKNFLDEMNDDKDDNETNLTRSEFERNHCSHEQTDSRDDTAALEFDDGASVVEEDIVDRMLPSGRKRRSDIGVARSGKKQKTNQAVFKEPERKRYRQPKISQSFHHSDRVPSGTSRHRRTGTNYHTGRRKERFASPPALGIVDFIEPNAPNFVKIAARSASRRKDMGRSKPSYKKIDLGNRTDNVDALSVLKDWRSGKLWSSSNVQRSSKQSRLQVKPQPKRQPLRSLSTNVRRQADTSARLSFTQPQKLTRQTNLDQFAISEESSLQSGKATKLRESTSHSGNDVRKHRPAQLEDEMPQDTGVAFTTRKKVLDLVFRKSRKEILASTFKLQQPAAVPRPVLSGQSENATDALPEPPQESTSTECQGSSKISKSTQRRPRKAAAPRRLDLEAPQIKHANDPLPLPNESDVLEEQNHLQAPEQTKITGLGPFGTYYTQHFDIFPLHDDTYFHHSTLIGDGTLKKVLDFRSTDLQKEARPATSFDIFNHHFHCGAWTDTVSSELGLLFDLLTEQLEPDKVSEDYSNQAQSIDCSNHILRYMLQSARLDPDESSAFTQRFSKLLLGFLDSTKSRRTAHLHDRTLLEINVRFLMCSLLVLRFSQYAGDISNDYLQAESLVQQYARVIIQQLLEFGLSPIRSLYNDLQRLSTRQRGIRNDAILAISWLIVLKIMSSVQIPRAGFWDLTGSAMANAAVLGTNDARKFEGLWEDMFALLPLGEFNDIGILSKGMRYKVPLQGWGLPQKLLKRVFDSYQSNPKQSPSFNDYCRALVARCHYLIAQWGWYKCVAVVGTIFDFFGNRNLSHLRNEEVYKSPDFLEELSGSPCLSVQPGDRCFHVFLKLLALAIQQLKKQGLLSDIRNLIARCLPNHNRQFSKEQRVHFDDLASLRNHHDLLCTLFWSAPPKDRRPVELIEKLVSPASSHKEACLINLRAWSQLARFVVSSGGTLEDYRPFMSWQNNIFQQILTQYLTAETDVQQQFMSLAKEKRKDIQQHMLDGIVKANQNAAKDILYASVQASADVMKHCPSLGSATFSFNVVQTNKVFDKLINTTGIDLDWGVLRACFDTIDSFMGRLETLWFKIKQASNDSVSSHDARSFEDAVEFLDDKVVRSFFAAARRAMGSVPLCEDPQTASPATVVEKAIILCGRIASLFIEGGKRQIRHFFSSGNSDLFGGLPYELDLAEKKYVPLFLATLLKNHVFNFSSIGCSHFDIWIQSVVKPFQALRYENYLAETLKKLGISYMQGATVIDGAAPTYDTNRDFFACGISYMRRELRQADVAQRKPLRTKYEKLLKLVMQQMKTDLKSLEVNSTAHKNYVRVVREIVGLIKSHGSDICTVDPFYYQVSAEYSPPEEDPQLHTAGIVAYGLRLEEGEMTAIPQLFHFLYNHFKISLANGRIEAEVEVVKNGMKHDHILAFVMGRMLPAIIHTSVQAPHVWPLLEVYSEALQRVLGKSFLPREIPQEFTDDVAMLLETIIDWFRHKSRDVAGNRLTATDVHVLTELVKVCNSIQPSLMCWLLLPPHDRDPQVQDCLDAVTALASSTFTYLDGLRLFSSTSDTTIALHLEQIDSTNLFTEWEKTIESRFPPQMDSYITSFASHLDRETRSNWVVTEDLITVKAAVTSSFASSSHQTQSHSGGGGVRNDLDKEETVGLFLSELKTLVDIMGRGGKGNGDENEIEKRRRMRRRRPRRVLDDGRTIEELLYDG